MKLAILIGVLVAVDMVLTWQIAIRAYSKGYARGFLDGYEGRPLFGSRRDDDERR